MASKELESMIAGLEPKQAKFLEGLMYGQTQTDAYVLAYGCPRESARSNAARLMANDSFRTVYKRAIAEAFDGLIDGLKELSPVLLQRIREILQSENEAVVVRVIDSILDRIGVVKTERREHTIDSSDSLRSKLLADLQRPVADKDEG